MGDYPAAWLCAGRKRFPGGQQQLCVDVGSDDKAVRRAVVPAILRCAARDGAARRVGEDRYRKPGDAALFLLSRGAELLALIERTVVLDARDAQAGHAGAFDRPLPGCEFLKRQSIALASLVDAQQTAAYGGDNFRLAADDPAGRVARRQAIKRQRLAERARSEEHTSELQSLMRIPYAVFRLKQKK